MFQKPFNAIDRRKRGCRFGPRKHGKCPARKSRKHRR